MTAGYHFHGDLQGLLRRRWRSSAVLAVPVDRAASIKDVIEAFGVPHTEIGQILCDGRDVDFSCPVTDGQRYDLHPVTPPWDVTRPTLLRPDPLDGLRFVVDVNVGRLARYLRMAGFDTAYAPDWGDEDLLGELVRGRRILLTRNRDLLKRRQVEFGRHVRSESPPSQLREIFVLFGANSPPGVFSRCLDCNAVLRPVAKEKVEDRLEPLTKRYYQRFSACGHCGKLFWQGSHVERMRRILRCGGH